MVVCEFCDKELSSKQSLKTHQLKTKYCLEKQSLLSNKIIETKNIEKCQYCNKNFTYLCSKTSHELICPEKEIQARIQTKILELQLIHEREINSLKEIINNLKIEQCKSGKEAEIYTTLFNKDQEFILNQSTKLLDKSGNITTTTNNIKSKYVTMNALNLSQERMHSIKDTYTLNHYERGGIGQADWVIENVLKDESGNIVYKCTDKNRRNFIYQDNKGNIITDIQAKKLKEAILPVIEKKLKEYKKIKYNELAEVDDDESELLEKCNELYKENKELGNEFDKRLVEKTYTS